MLSCFSYYLIYLKTHLPFITEYGRIWIIGSSIVKQAYEHTSKRPTGENLGLDRYGYLVTWIGHSGMKWRELTNMLTTMVSALGVPDILIIHCGANDIGQEPCGKLLHEMKVSFINLIWYIVPGCTIIFSQMLPRLSWRYSDNVEKMERTRKRINKGVRSFLYKRRCYVIKHPDFDDKLKTMFSDDGVHLSFIG